MPSTAKEVAKLLSGIAFSESVGHWWLGLWGQHMLPWDFGWFTFTSGINTIAMVVWPIAFVGLVWFAWLRGPRASPT